MLICDCFQHFQLPLGWILRGSYLNEFKDKECTQHSSATNINVLISLLFPTGMPLEPTTLSRV